MTDKDLQSIDVSKDKPHEVGHRKNSKELRNHGKEGQPKPSSGN